MRLRGRLGPAARRSGGGDVQWTTRRLAGSKCRRQPAGVSRGRGMVMIGRRLYSRRRTLRYHVSLSPDGGRGNALPSPAAMRVGLPRRRVVSRRHRGAVGLAIVSQLAGWQATHANA